MSLKPLDKAFKHIFALKKARHFMFLFLGGRPREYSLVLGKKISEMENYQFRFFAMISFIFCKILYFTIF